MAKQALNFSFHNPNTVEASATYLLQLFIQANQAKIEQAIQAEANKKRLSEA